MPHRIRSSRSVLSATAVVALALGAAGLGACGNSGAKVSAVPTTVVTRIPKPPRSRPTPPGVARLPAPPGVDARGITFPPLPPMPKFVPSGALTRSAETSALGARRGLDMFGDSLVLQSWPYVHRIAADRGQPFDGGAYGGTALCDWLPAILSALRDHKPAYLVLAFVGNNLTRCTLGLDGRRVVGARLAAEYRFDAQQAITAARDVGTTVFLVGPPAMRNPVTNRDAALLRRAMRGLALENAGVVYLDSDKVLSPRGYRVRGPCLAFETTALGCRNHAIVLRAHDGVHLGAPVGGEGGYSGGVWRYANVLMRGIPNAR